MNLNYLEETIRTSKYLVCLAGMEFMREQNVAYHRDSDESYRIEEKYGYSPEELFSARMFNTHAELFYEYYRNEILSKHLEAGKGNEALARLEEAGYLKTIITKGIYNMPQKAGCKNVINMYGNIYENNACPRCGKIFPIEYIKNSDKVPLCDVCKSTVIHPGVYLHGEMLSNTVISHAVEEVAKADTILVLGMNLNSSLCKDMLPHFTGKDLIVIHKEPHYLDEKATAAYHGAVSKILPEVAEKHTGCIIFQY